MMSESRRTELDDGCQTSVRPEETESGQGMVEYALILVLIAIPVIFILTFMGHQVNNAFSNISSGLGQ
jgi:pilus assembly protein Flp/PilA